MDKLKAGYIIMGNNEGVDDVIISCIMPVSQRLSSNHEINNVCINFKKDNNYDKSIMLK